MYNWDGDEEAIKFILDYWGEGVARGTMLLSRELPNWPMLQVRISEFGKMAYILFL